MSLESTFSPTTTESITLDLPPQPAQELSSDVWEQLLPKMVGFADQLNHHRETTISGEDIAMRATEGLLKNSGRCVQILDDQGMNRLTSYAFRAVQNHHISKVRHDKIVTMIPDENSEIAAHHAGPHNTEAEALATTPEDLSQKLTAINISDDQRKVLELKVIHEMTDAEIATTLNIASPTVRTRLHRVKHAIRHAFGNDRQALADYLAR